jgi:uncharacterized protein (TIGR02284 family)
MPGAQGAEQWTAGGRNRTVLIDERRLPFAAGTFDRILLVHALEEADDPKALLTEAVRALGGQPHESGSILAKAQRAVMDVKQALMPDEAGSVGAADHGEAALDRRFEAAIKDERLSATTRETLRRAHALIHHETQAVHDLHASLDSQRDLGSGLYPQ